MIIIKRNGSEAEFNIQNIITAISKANAEVIEAEQLTEEQIQKIAKEIEEICRKRARALNVEEIQDLVETKIMECGAFEIARRYIKYRYNRELARKSNSTDGKILTLIESNNEEAKIENANKNPVLNSTQRDYMAAEVSKDVSRRILLTPDIVEAHDDGRIHFHDMDCATCFSETLYI